MLRAWSTRRSRGPTGHRRARCSCSAAPADASRPTGWRCSPPTARWRCRYAGSGGADQPPGICEVALETFAPALDRLAAQHSHLAVLGVSKGAEAALLLAARDARIRCVAALSPTSVVWANVGPGRDGEVHPYRSSWTADGRPLAFVPYDDGWEPAGDPPSFVGLYERSLAAFPDAARAAAIPVDQITADVLVSAGGDDRVWPSARFAREIAIRRARAGLSTETVRVPGAGHRVTLPGEPPPRDGAAMARGGGAVADARMGSLVFAVLTRLLRLF